jgi:hypothetical protein
MVRPVVVLVTLEVGDNGVETNSVNIVEDDEDDEEEVPTEEKT